MNILFLRNIDRWLGPLLLAVLAPIVGLISALLYGKNSPQASLTAETKNCVFLKLKGGGSLIIALPALLALRRMAPKANFLLVCTPETKAYAELTGIFDRYCLIQDTSPVALATSAFQALKECQRADICIDLEPNSVLAAVFCILTMAHQRFGFVKPDERYRAHAYTKSIFFNLMAPIYVFYDQLAQLLGGTPVPVPECREQLLHQVHQKTKGSDEMMTIGFAPFTSEFAPERMMPVNVWIDLLRQEHPDTKLRLVVLGSQKNRSVGKSFATSLRQAIPMADVIDLCGQCTLAETTAELATFDQVWAIDSGVLHIARLVAKSCYSFWGPSNPAQRLRPIADLKEKTFYRNFSCSPCAHVTRLIPCGGNNLCMKTMADPSPNITPIWHAGA